MPEQWTMICRLKDMPLAGARMVQRGLAWQELPGVALFRGADDTVHALLDMLPVPGASLAGGTLDGAQLQGPCGSWLVDLGSDRLVAPVQATVRRYAVRLMDGRIYLDVKELNIPASRAEQALAGSFALLPHVQMA